MRSVICDKSSPQVPAGAPTCYSPGSLQSSSNADNTPASFWQDDRSHQQVQVHTNASPHSAQGLQNSVPSHSRWVAQHCSQHMHAAAYACRTAAGRMCTSSQSHIEPHTLEPPCIASGPQTQAHGLICMWERPPSPFHFQCSDFRSWMPP